MNPTTWVLTGLALAWCLVSYVLAEQPFIHIQTYAVVIVIFLFAMVRTVFSHMRAGTELIAPREETIALAGVSLASIATLLCCLLAPGPVEVSGSPGERIAVPEHDLSIQFPRSAEALADTSNLHATAVFDARHSVEIGNRVPLLFSDMMLRIHPKTVVTIEARGIGGDTLTITQPSGGAFLSPLLLFPKTMAIAELTLPADAFAIPARGRTVRAFLVTPSLERDPRVARMSNGTPGVLFSVDDTNGKPLAHGIGFAADGLPQQLADIVLQPKLGLFPSVTVASVPSPIPMLIGIAAFAFGGGTLWYRRKYGNMALL